MIKSDESASRSAATRGPVVFNDPRCTAEWTNPVPLASRLNHWVRGPKTLSAGSPVCVRLETSRLSTQVQEPLTSDKRSDRSFSHHLLAYPCTSCVTVRVCCGLYSADCYHGLTEVYAAPNDAVGRGGRLAKQQEQSKIAGGNMSVFG